MTDNKKIVTVIIAAGLVFAVLYVIYLSREKEELADENDFLRKRILEGNATNTGVVNFEDVPSQVKPEFIQAVRESTPVKMTYRESMKRVLFLKNKIETNDGYKIFYKDGKPIIKEKDIHCLYDLTWLETPLDVNKEVNNGRGSVDFKISAGQFDQTIVEFKLASNTKIRKNLENQTNIYQRANGKAKKIIVIIYLSEKQEQKIQRILHELNLSKKRHVVLIDARSDNKISASVA